jgi:hypothetical protein
MFENLAALPQQTTSEQSNIGITLKTYRKQQPV